MAITNKSIWRWIGEAGLVFGSVVGAFYFEDVREDLREKDQYKNLLLNLRNDIHDDVFEFRLMADTAVGKCPLCLDTADLNYIEKYLRFSIGEREKATELVLFMGVTQYPKWRFPSPYYQEITHHSDLIERDSLRTAISLYHEIYLSEHTIYQELNEQNTRNRYLLQRTLDYTDSTSRHKVLDIMEFRNAMLANSRITKSALRSDLKGAADLSSIVEKMDAVLHKHSVDTSSLDKQWLIKSE